MGNVIQFYAARHGETASNATNTIQGRVDEPLNAKGEQQAVALGYKMPLNDITMIFCSPFQRAVKTAEIVLQVANRDIPIVKMDYLYERDFGSLSGMTWQQVLEKFGAAKADELWRADRHTLTYDYRQYGGESAEQVRQRTQLALDRVKDYLGKGGTGLVITSAGIIRHLDELFFGAVPEKVENAAFKSYTLPNAKADSITRCLYDEEGYFIREGRFIDGFLREYRNWVLEVSWKQHTLGCLVISSKRQCVLISNLTVDELAELTLVMAQAQLALRQCRYFMPDHFNYLQLGNVVEQLQLHLVPRYISERRFCNRMWVDETFGKPIIWKFDNIDAETVLQIRRELDRLLI